MKGVISCIDRDEASLVRKARQAPCLGDQDLVGEVSCREPKVWISPGPALAQPGGDGPAGNGAAAECVAYDFGLKRNILRLLRECGFDVTVLPGATTADELLALAPDAVFLSNGPGDPTMPGYAIGTVSEPDRQELPIFGICLGHQIAALAVGATDVQAEVRPPRSEPPGRRTSLRQRWRSRPRTTATLWIRTAFPAAWR